MAFLETHPRLSFIPENEAARPKGGNVQCVIDHWWCVHPEKGLVIWDKECPQANPNRTVTETCLAKLYPWAVIKQIPVVFMQQRS